MLHITKISKSKFLKPAKKKADNVRAYKIEHATELAEKTKQKQVKFDAKKLASKKAPKDATYYQSRAYYFVKDTPLDLKKIVILTMIEDQKKRSLKQSIADKAAHKAAKIQFKAEHPQRTIVSTLPETKKKLTKKEMRIARKPQLGAPKAILSHRNAA